MKPVRLFCLVAVPFFVLPACSDNAEQKAAASTETKSAVSQPAPPKVAVAPPLAQVAVAPPVADPHAGMKTPGPQPAGGGNEGRVLTVTEAGPYTYIEVDSNGRRLWLAGNRMAVAVGENIRWGDSAVMRNFQSKTLGRTFDTLLFVSQVSKASPAGQAAAVPSAARGQVVSVTNSGGYSYIEVDGGVAGKKWLAAPVGPVKSGDVITWGGGATMRNFASKSLNRTFEQIDFVGSVQVVN